MAATSTETRAERRAVFVLLLIAAVALALRVTTIAQPLGIDQSLWASAVRGMARGQLLYRDVWEQRPPGIYLAYLSAFTVLGWREATLAWLDLAASAATTMLIYGVVRPLSGRLMAALASALYAVLTAPAWLYGYGGFLERSVCETFTVLCASVAAWAAVRIRAGSARPLMLAALLGMAVGIAVVFKPNAGLYLPAVLLWLLVYGDSAVRTVGASARLIVTACLASAVAPLLTFVWLWAIGVLPEARVAIVDFNRFYLSTNVTLDAVGLAFAKAVWLRMKTDPLWAAGGAGAVLAIATIVRERRLGPLPGLVVIWGGAAALVIFVNGIRLFNSYFINAVAPLSIMAAWVMADARGRSMGRRLLSGAVAAVVLWLLVSRGYGPRVFEAAGADLQALTGAIPRTVYLERFGGYANGRGYSARANAELAAYVAAHTAPSDPVFLFGINGTGLYFLADRLIAQRFLRVNFFVPEVFPNPAFRRAAVVAELRARRPKYVVFERVHTASDVNQQIDALPMHPDVLPWLAAEYSLETVIEDFSVYRLK